MFKKVAIVLGTRPEAIKLIPVYLELKKRRRPVHLISTGQHKSMLDQIFNFFGISPDIELAVMIHNQTLAGLTARLTDALQQCFDSYKFDLVIVQGDTTTAMVSALVAYYNRVYIAHVEAGLRTYNKFSPYPEEVNRQIIGRIADYHFAPTLVAEAVLKREGLDKVYMVGNTVIDSLLLCLDKLTQAHEKYEQKYDLLKKYDRLVLITCHRRENFGEAMIQIWTAIKALSSLYPTFLFYYPVHLNPNVKEKVYDVLDKLPNVFLGSPLPYDELVFLMSRSFIIITDSGGIQEEAPSLNVPVLVTRTTTERMEGVQSNCARLVGTRMEAIVETFVSLINQPELYMRMASAPNPYGDGNSAQLIVDLLLSQK